MDSPMMIDSTSRWAYGLTRGDQTKVYRTWLHNRPFYREGGRIYRSHVTPRDNIRTNHCAQMTHAPYDCIQGTLYAIGEPMN